MTRRRPSPSSATVVFLVKRFPRLSETFVLNEFLELRRQGVQLELFAIRDPHETSVQPEARELQDEVTYLRETSWWPLFPAILRSARRHPAGLVAALKWVIPRANRRAWTRLGEALVLVDLLEGRAIHLHVHWAHAPAGVAYLAHRIAGIPWSLTTHAKDLYTMPIRDVADRCNQATFVVTCTSANVAFLTQTVGIDPAKVVLCRHGVRLDRFRPQDRAPEPGRILSIGRLVAKKGFPTLLDACVILRERGINFHLDVVGDGPLSAELAELVGRLALDKHVTLHAARPQNGLVEFYWRASVFALAPSVQANGDRDGVPNVILEAMACGVPVVTTAISGIPEVVSDGETGLLVPSGDASAFASALELLLSDQLTARALGMAGEHAVRRAFELDSCVAPLRALLEESLASVGRRPEAVAV